MDLFAANTGYCEQIGKLCPCDTAILAVLQGIYAIATCLCSDRISAAIVARNRYNAIRRFADLVLACATVDGLHFWA